MNNREERTERMHVANEFRANIAAARTSAEAERVLADKPWPVTRRSELALRLRVKYSDLTLGQLAAKLGWTKHQFSGALRRGLTGKNR